MQQSHLFKVDEMIGLEIIDDTFDDDPPGYRRGDKHLNVICELYRGLSLDT